MATPARGGTFDAQYAPTNPASAMFTLDDIYHRLNAWANAAKRPGGFAEPGEAPTNGTMHTLDEIMALAAAPVLAPVPKTGQTTTHATGDDGWYSASVGAAWPDPRFTAGTGTASNCVADNLTGLMWLRNPDAATRTWAAALAYCENLNGESGRGGYTDWRLPNRNELGSLINCQYDDAATWLNTQGFTGIPESGGVQYAKGFWTSTAFAPGGTFAWTVYLDVGFGGDYLSASYYVWPVRGGQH